VSARSSVPLNMWALPIATGHTVTLQVRNVSRERCRAEGAALMAGPREP
jgi:hypothetical protein